MGKPTLAIIGAGAGGIAVGVRLGRSFSFALNPSWSKTYADQGTS